MDEMNNSPENVETLQQMSEDMKLHIAQLKAELGSSDFDGIRSYGSLPKLETADKSVHGSLLKTEIVSLPLRPTTSSSDLDAMNEADNVHHQLGKVDPSPTPIVQENNDDGFSEDEKKSATSHTSVNENNQSPRSLRAEGYEVKSGAKLGRSQNNSSSSLASHNSGRAADPLDVKYLQMSSNSPKLVKRLAGASQSTPTTARGSRSDPSFLQSESSSRVRDDLRRQNEKLEGRLVKMRMQCEILAEENIKLKKEERAKAIEKIATLKKSNGELANIAKRLEEKARGLQDQNVKKSQELANVTRELQQQKRHYQRHKGRWEAELARVTSHSSEQPGTLKNQLEDLKRALRQLRREKYAQQEDEDSEGTKQKELLRLQKLAIAASSKVIVRSLSTPTTARQKILEESNRGLRKQVLSFEKRAQESEARLASLRDAEERLEEARRERSNMQQNITELKSSVMLLESELQQAKVEASDTSVQLSELKHVHEQVEAEYATVHQQLAVAIKERDQAVRRCVDESSKLVRVQEAFTEAKRSEESLRDQVEGFRAEHQEKIRKLEAAHEKEVAEHRENLTSMQEKLAALEGKYRQAEEKLAMQEARLTRSTPSPLGGSTSPHRTVRLPADVTALKQLTADLAIERVEKHSPATSSADSANSSYEDSDEDADGRGELFVAKYCYNPYEGPNENPQCELPLVAGDFLYIHGQPDEDGFFEGEKLDGRRGLVPSNFIEALRCAGDDPAKNRTRSTYSDVINTSHSLSGTSSSYVGRSFEEVLPHPTGMRATVRHQHDVMIELAQDSSSLDQVEGWAGQSECDGEFHLTTTCYTTMLYVEWRAPVLEDDDVVTRYDVILNGCLATSTKSEEVILKEIYKRSDENYVISVCCVTARGRSDPGLCTTTMTSDDLTIEGLTCEFVASECARLAWQPFDSALACKVSVGEVGSDDVTRLPRYQRQILVPRPMYRHTIEGLKSGREYEAVVELSKSGARSTVLRFCTTTSQPPKPPSNVEIESLSPNVALSWLHEASPGQGIVGYHLLINGVLVGGCTAPRCEVDRLHFANQVVAVIKHDATLRLPDSSYPAPPSAWVAVRAVGSGGLVSDLSPPCYLPPDSIVSLCHEVEYKLKATSPPNGIELRGADRSRSMEDSLLGTNSTSLDLDLSLSCAQMPSKRPSSHLSKLSSCQLSSKSQSLTNVSHGQSHGNLPRRFSSSPESSFSEDLRTSGASKNSAPAGEDDSSASPHDCSASDRNHVHAEVNAPVSLYVALFDYTPNIMSPNSDCYEDELDFVEGQLLKVYGGSDEDGFLVGEDRQGRRGFVPSNMVANVEVDDYSMLEVLFERGALSTASPHPPSSSNSTQKAAVDFDSSLPRRSSPSSATIYRALYDYDPREASPNIDSEIELSFVRGDLISIFSPADEDGFFRGEMNGQYGLVPSNFVEKVGEPPRVSSSSASNASSAKGGTLACPSLRIDSNAQGRRFDPLPLPIRQGRKKGMLSKGKRLLKKLGSDKSKR